MTPSPTLLLAVDPGTVTGLALFLNGGLNRAWSSKDPCKFTPSSADVLAIERPMIYPAERGSTRNPNDMIAVAIIAGTIVGATGCADVRWFYPHEWKGQLPKGVAHARIRERLDPREQTIFDAIKGHDARDAVGIGLHALGRGFKS